MSDDITSNNWRDIALPNAPKMRVRRSDVANDLRVYPDGSCWADATYWLTDDGWMTIRGRVGDFVGVPIMCY